MTLGGNITSNITSDFVRTSSEVWFSLNRNQNLSRLVTQNELNASLATLVDQAPFGYQLYLTYRQARVKNQDYVIDVTVCLTTRNARVLPVAFFEVWDTEGLNVVTLRRRRKLCATGLHCTMCYAHPIKEQVTNWRVTPNLFRLKRQVVPRHRTLSFSRIAFSYRFCQVRIDWSTLDQRKFPRRSL